MKKLIYPIALLFVLITVSAFSIHYPGSKCTKKEAKKDGVHSTRHAQKQVTAYVVPFTTQNQTANVVSESLPIETGIVDIFVPSFQVSDDIIGSQFNRDETTIEKIEDGQADLILNKQFNTENAIASRE